MPQQDQHPVTIRYLADCPEVIPAVASWIYHEWSFLYVGQTQRYVETFLHARLHKRKLPLTFVAFRDRKPVGTVSLKQFDMETRPDLTPWVASLYVVKRLRGEGIGSLLMKQVEEKAVRLGFRKMFLFTADRGLAKRFYGRLGWRIKETTRERSYSIIVMEKRTSVRTNRS